MRRSRTRQLGAAVAALLGLPLVALTSTPAGAAGAAPTAPTDARPSAAAAPAAPTAEAAALPRDATGYRLIAADGGVFDFGSAAPIGSGASTAGRVVVDAALAPGERGAWLASPDGEVTAVGDAPDLGPTTVPALTEAVVGIAATPGTGYWTVASDGGIFSYGDAQFFGSTGAVSLNQPIVGMAPALGGLGYFLVASDGGIFTFGDAAFHGSTGDVALNQPIVGMATTPTGDGYWLVASDGGIFAFGDATFFGSTGDVALNQPIVGMAATPTGLGYWLVASDGGIFTFGDAEFFGSTGSVALNQPIVDLEPADQLPADFVLTVLHNNDGESKIFPVDGYGGAAYFATKVHELQQAAVDAPLPAQLSGVDQGVVTLSSGDNFLAGPEFNASLERDPSLPLYDSILLDLVGYDAATIGNHEFDFGPEVLARFVDGAGDLTFLSSNIDVAAVPELVALRDAGRIAPSTVITEAGREIGVIGAITPGLASISSPEGVVILQDVAGIVQAEIDALTAQGVDHIIVSSHLQDIDEEVALVSQLTDVDVVIAGGGDELLANEGDLLVPGDEVDDAFGSYPLVGTDADGRAVPIVTTPGDYQYVGELRIAFDADGDLLEVVDGGLQRVAATGPDAVAPDPQVQAQVVDPIQAAVDELAETVVATSEVALDARNPDPIRVRESNLGNLVADAMLYVGQREAAANGLDVPVVSLQNGGGIRNNSVIPAGPITALDTFSILPFTNFVSIVEDLTPADLKELLEHSVSASPSPNGLFGHWGGIVFEYSLAGTAQVIDVPSNTVLTPGTRIVNAELADGTPIITGGVVDPGAPATIAMAVINFTAEGGDNYPFADKTPQQSVGVSYQQALFDYLTGAASPVVLGGLPGLAGTVTSIQYPEVPDVASAARIVLLP